jgi:hypothetical protein
MTACYSLDPNLVLAKNRRGNKPKLTQNYVNGASTVPLIYKTIGRAFDDAVVRWGNREVLVVCHQGIR